MDIEVNIYKGWKYMILNGKGYKNWSEDDIVLIIDNDSYKESEFIDYKEYFAVLECTDKIQRKKKQDEFRHDVCSFANAEGGYMLFGIKEKAGIPFEIVGISIDNIDRFELDRRNELFGIMPVVPIVDFSFVQLKNGNYIVIMKIFKGIHKPYIFIENEGIFKFFVRRGNRKQAMSYMEIRNYFLQSNLLADEIKNFRNQKMLSYQQDLNRTPFALIQMIPRDFFETSERVALYDVFRKGELNFHNIFDGLCYGHAFPNVDGICFPSYDYDNGIVLQLYNNGITELIYKVAIREKQGENWIWGSGIVQHAQDLIQGTARLYEKMKKHSAMYVCISIFGCKGLWSDEDFYSDYYAKVDRDEIFCMPLEIYDILDSKNVSEVMEECKKMINYSLGIRKLS